MKMFLGRVQEGVELNFTKFLSLLNKENILCKMKVSKNLKD